MKFLYFGDLHERPTAPVHRKDDFRETVNQKIQEIRELGKKHKVSAFLQPGDFLDKPKFEPAFLSEVVNRWGFSDIRQDMLHLATGQVKVHEVASKLQDYIPIIGAIGNHELYGESLKSYPKTSLAFLEKIGFMHLPSKEKPFIFTDESGFTVAITATHYDIGMDDPSRIDDYIIEEKMGDYHIHIVHGYLTNKDMGNLFPHTTVDDIAKKTQADLTITGHDHIGFSLLKVDGKQFVNSGAIVRLSNDVKEVRRKPKVLLIDIDKEKGIQIKTIYLKSAEKGEDVLDRSHQAFQQSMSHKMEEIKSLVNKSKVGSGFSITEIIQRISESEQLDEELKNRAIRAVTDKMDAIQNQTIQADDYYIEKIVLENFQSHQYSEYELQKGLNVFIGKSSSGKSAIQRALAWVYENDGRDPRRFIKNGETFTKVSLFLSNGFVISRFVEKKKSGKNGYEVFDPRNGETSYYNTKSLPLIQEYLGFNYLELDEKRNIPLNFQKQGMSWFFIGDGFTNTDRAKIIGAVYQTHFVDAVIKDFESEVKKQTIRLKDKKKEIQELEEKMEQFHHLPQLAQTIQEVEDHLNQLQEQQQRLDRIKSLVLQQEQLEKQIKENERIVTSLSSIPLVEQRYQEVFHQMARYEKTKQLAEQLIDAESRIRENQRTLATLNQLESAESKFLHLQQTLQQYHELAEKVERARALEQELTKTQQQIQRCEQIMDQNKHILVAEEKMNRMEQSIRLVEQGKVLLAQQQDIVQKGRLERQEIKRLDAQNEELVGKYQELLKQVGTCPTCQSAVSDTVIDQIAQNYLQ